MASKKEIKLNFHQITPLTTSNLTTQEKEKAANAIANVFTTLPVQFRPIILDENRIELYKSIEQNANYFLGTLINNRVSGIPAKFNNDTKTLSQLPLSDKDGLAQPVNFLFDPTINVVMMEAIRGGVSIANLCQFLAINFDLPDLEHAIVINPEKMQKFYDMREIRKFKVKFARIENGQIFNQNSKSKSIFQITSSADNTSTDTLEYSLGVKGKGKSLNTAFIVSCVTEALGFKATEEVQKLEVVGRENEDGFMETINLIEHALRDKIEIKRERLQGDFARSDRFKQLIEIYDKHKKSLHLTYKLKKI